MIDLFAKEQSDNLPEFVDITYEQVQRFWDDWIMWRSFGRRNMSGQFEPSVGYVEAIQGIPQEELHVFLQLDDLYGRMERQYIKQTKGSNG